MTVEDKDSQRPTDAMPAIEPEPDHAPGDATIIEERLGPGTVVGGYEIDGELGRGSMGVVYAATHPVIGKRVAIKVLRQVGDRAAVQRFVLEARTVNEIGHRNIVDVFDFGTLPDGREYLVMDMLIGETLGARLLRGPLTLTDAAMITSECASALAAAHAKGIVHRDLKPDNVFLVATPNSTRIGVKLLDFGLVKLVKADLSVRTKTGVVLGTADYMSPEQGRGRDVDHRTDIYALGVMTFQMLAGRLPFPRASFLEALVAHAEEPVPSLASIVPSTPKQIVQLIEAMMAKDRYKRPNLSGVRAVLKKFRPHDSIPPESTTIAAIPPVPMAPPPVLQPATLRGAGVATPAKPLPAIARPDPEESRPTSDFVPVSTPVVSIPIGAPPIEVHDDEPIDPPTLIARPIEPAQLTPAGAAASLPPVTAPGVPLSTHAPRPPRDAASSLDDLMTTAPGIPALPRPLDSAVHPVDLGTTAPGVGAPRAPAVAASRSPSTGAPAPSTHGAAPFAPSTPAPSTHGAAVYAPSTPGAGVAPVPGYAPSTPDAGVAPVPGYAPSTPGGPPVQGYAPSTPSGAPVQGYAPPTPGAPVQGYAPSTPGAGTPPVQGYAASTPGAGSPPMQGYAPPTPGGSVAPLSGYPAPAGVAPIATPAGVAPIATPAGVAPAGVAAVAGYAAATPAAGFPSSSATPAAGFPSPATPAPFTPPTGSAIARASQAPTPVTQRVDGTPLWLVILVIIVIVGAAAAVVVALAM